MQAFRPVCCPTPWSSPLAVWSQLSYLTLRYFPSQFVEERLGLNLAKCFLTCLEQCVHWHVSLHLNQCLAKCLHLHLCLSACQCIDQRLASMMASFSTSVLTSTTAGLCVNTARLSESLLSTLSTSTKQEYFRVSTINCASLSQVVWSSMWH